MFMFATNRKMTTRKETAEYIDEMIDMAKEKGYFECESFEISLSDIATDNLRNDECSITTFPANKIINFSW